MGSCSPDVTAITLWAPKHICNVYYDDCSNALTIVFNFPLGFWWRRAHFGISTLWLLLRLKLSSSIPALFVRTVYCISIYLTFDILDSTALGEPQWETHTTGSRSGCESYPRRRGNPPQARRQKRLPSRLHCRCILHQRPITHRRLSLQLWPIRSTQILPLNPHQASR